MTTRISEQVRRLAIEGSVIVVSILLAFGIDAMWAEHQLRLEEREALTALRADFDANLESVDRVIAAHLQFRERVARLTRLSPEEIRALPQKTVSEMMLALANPWTFDPVTSTADTLLSSGKLGVLRDQELRQAIITFRGFLSDLEEDTNYVTQGAIDYWRLEYRYGGPWTDPATELGYHGPVNGLDFIPLASAEDLLNVRADPELIGSSRRFHINVAYYLSELNDIRDQIVVILELLGEAGTAR